MKVILYSLVTDIIPFVLLPKRLALNVLLGQSNVLSVLRNLKIQKPTSQQGRKTNKRK
jgi:hypothetical protein